MAKPDVGDQRMGFDQLGYSLIGVRDFALYRGAANDGNKILLKTSDRADQAAEHAAQLAREAQMTIVGGGDWAVRPLGLTHIQGAAALLLDDPGGVPLYTIMTTELGVAERLRLAVGISRAVRGMHAQGVMHRDLRPENILADAASGNARLMGLTMDERCTSHHQAWSGSWPGSLAHMAPEQSGRTGAVPDARSDLYALGIVLYELLCGHLPFSANTPMEWIHCHLAREPRLLQEEDPAIPIQVSRIVSKLLRKSPDERYQSAKGLEADLQRCLTAALRGSVETFPLGRFDPASMLRQSGTVIGRDRELAALIEAFEQVADSGRSAVVLVRGEAGAGKTALVEQTRRLLQPSRVIFAAGKSDPVHAEVPYSALKVALKALVDRLLGEDQARHELTKVHVRRALGDSGGLIATMVPEIEALIGETAPDASSPETAGARMIDAIRRLLASFTAQGQVLVLFLDDLQWADVGTIELLCNLVERGDGDRILMVCALRPSTAGIEPDAPRQRQLARLAAAARGIPIAPLEAGAIHALVASLLQVDLDQAAPLAPIVGAATGGNPFAIGQFLYSLADDGLLTYDAALARWSWDQAEITQRAFTDDVADLLVSTLRKLTPGALLALEWLSCLGSDVRDALFESATADAERLRSALAEAIQAGFLLRQDKGYRFTHDRIRDAVYEGIPALRRASCHAEIAARLLEHRQAAGRDVSIYDVTAQFNLASIDSHSAGVDPALASALNLDAAREAKAANNYPAALGYCRHGTDLLPETAWSSHYGLMLALHMLAAECEILTGERALADARLAALADRAANLLDLGAVTRLRVSLFTAMDRSDEAVATGLAYLARLGPAWSPRRGTSIQAEYAALLARLDGRTIESLADLPRMADPVFEGAVNVLAEVMSPASFLDPELHDLIPLRLANLSLEHGLAEASCFAFVHLAMVIGPAFGAYEIAFRFGQLGLDLTSRPGLDRVKPKVLMCLGNLVLPWTRPVREGQPLIRAAFELAKTSGDINFAAYSCNNLVSNMLLAGDPLPHVEEEIRWGLAYAERVSLGRVSLILKAQLMLVRTLRDGAPTPGESAGSDADAAAMERMFADAPRLAVAEYCYWVRQLQMRVLTGRYREAQDAATRAKALMWTSPYFLETAEFHLYAGLAYALAEHETGAAAAAAQVTGHRDQAAIWHASCPDNFAAMFHLLSAEVARLDDRPSDAAELYERAIACGRRFGMPHHEALASECAGAFYRQRSLPIAAEGYEQNAVASYGRWGAAAKLRQAGSRGATNRTPFSPPPHGPGLGSGTLDIATVLRASQAVSEEIVLETLIERLLHLALENVGADRGALLLLQDQKLEVIGTAETRTSGTVIQIAPFPSPLRPLPTALINRVARSRQSVILDDAQAPSDAGSALCAAGDARSVLCLPLMKRGALIGVLYMENTLSPHVFSEERLSTLELIGAQAAISIENARLYEELHQDIARRIAIEEDLRRSRTFLAAAQQVSRVGSWYWDEGAHTVVWSDEQFRLLGYAPDQTPASFDAFWARVHPDDLEDARKILDAGFRTQVSCSAAFRVVLPDGQVRYMESLSTPVPRPNNQLFDFVGTLMDVTERRQAEEGLKMAEAELARVSRLTTMGQLMASIAHEVNQPLAAIVTNASAGVRWLERSPPDIGEARVLMARIAEQGARAGDIIRGLRGLANKSGTERALFAFKDALDEVLVLTGAELRRHRVTLVVHLTPRHPVVLGDRVQIQQVLINLVMNAAEAMADRPGTRLLSIMSDKVDDDRLHVEISDTGSGIRPEDADRIFDAFYTTKATGMGMGLSICRSIVEAHGGRLTAVARNVGTVFSFSLPSDTGNRE